MQICLVQYPNAGSMTGQYRRLWPAIVPATCKWFPLAQMGVALSICYFCWWENPALLAAYHYGCPVLIASTWTLVGRGNSGFYICPLFTTTRDYGEIVRDYQAIICRSVYCHGLCKCHKDSGRPHFNCQPCQK